MGTGECAGEVISRHPVRSGRCGAAGLRSPTPSGERKLRSGRCACLSRHAPGRAVAGQDAVPRRPDDPDTIVSEFRRRFYDTGLLGDRYAGNKFAEYLFRRHEAPPRTHARSGAPHRRGSAALHRSSVCMPRLVDGAQRVESGPSADFRREGRPESCNGPSPTWDQVFRRPIPDPIRLDDFIPLFHRWIQEQAIDGHLLIDVHDYSHIQQGPGILLVGARRQFQHRYVG